MWSRFIVALVAALASMFAGSAATHAADVTLPSGVLTGNQQDVTVPITVSPADGVFSLDLAVDFDPAVLSPLSVYKADLTDDFTLTFNIAIPGRVDISLFGTQALSGSGEVVWIRFRAIGAAGTSTTLTFHEASLNEGEIPSVTADGDVAVVTPGSVISAADDAQGAPGSRVYVPIHAEPADGIDDIDLVVRYNPNVIVASSVRRTVYTQNFTLSYNVTQPGVAQISLHHDQPLVGSGDLVEVEFDVVGALGEATPLAITQISLNQGLLPATRDDGLFTVTDDPIPACRIRLPAAEQAAVGGDLVVPVTVDPADGVLSLDLDFTFDPAVLAVSEVYKTAFTEDMTLTENLATPGRVDLSLFGTQPLAGSGAVAWVTFDVLGSVGQNTNLNWLEASLNEGAIPCLAEAGAASVATAPVRVSVPDDAQGGPGDTVVVPITAAPADGLGLDFRLEYNSILLSAINVTKTPLALNHTLNFNVGEPGVVLISLFGDQPLTGSGDLVEIGFSVLGAIGRESPLDLTRAEIDEGAIGTVMDDGLFVICDNLDADTDQFSVCEGDCNDQNDAVNPGESEIGCDGLDNDCNAATEDVLDADSDTFACDVDCDDELASCTTDCVTDVDVDGTTDCADFCLDTDGDGYGNAGGAGDTCTGLDCDDLEATCNVDCVTDADSDATTDCLDTCVDSDGDGFGSAGGAGNTCAGADCNESEVTCNVDCVTDDDSDATIDCLDTCVDRDGDGFGDAGGAGNTCSGADCDDMAASCTTDCSDPDSDLLPTCAGDCAPNDGNIFALPAQADMLTIAADEQTLIWTDQSDAEVYNVYKGIVPEFTAFGYGHTCHALGLTDATSQDPAVPRLDSLIYYFVSADNCFGAGPLGDNSLGSPRPGPDACVDSDSDGVTDLVDNCVDTQNTQQADSDFDGSGDLCDPCPLDPTNSCAVGDADQDGIPDDLDNCPNDQNPDQADFDADGSGDVCDPDDDADGSNDDVDNCPFVGNPDQADTDSDGTGDACEDDGQPYVAVVKLKQAFGGWLVGTPYEGASTHLQSRWRISTSDGAGFDAGVIWDVTVDRAPLDEVRALYDHPEVFGTLYARVDYLDSSGWSGESPSLAFSPVALPLDNGGDGATAGVVEIADHFSGPDQLGNFSNNLDLGGLLWSPALSTPSITGRFFALENEKAVHADAGSAARVQTGPAISQANSFLTAVIEPETPNDNDYDFSMGLRASGAGASHNSYRCKVERILDSDTIRFNKYTNGFRSNSVASWSGDLGPAPWLIRCEVVTIGAAVRIRAYQWNGQTWVLKTEFLDDGMSGISSWDSTPRILTPGQVVLSNEKEGRTRYVEVEAGRLP